MHRDGTHEPIAKAIALQKLSGLVRTTVLALMIEHLSVTTGSGCCRHMHPT
jgi:hypothetical protein